MQQLTGINAIVTQIGYVISQHNAVFGFYAPFILNVIQLAATYSAIHVTGHFGRKPILLSGNLGLAICDIVIGVLFIFIQQSLAIFWIVFVILIIYMIIYGLTLGPIIRVYLPQIVPITAVPFATNLNWLGGSIAIFILPVINDYLGSQVVFFVFGGITLIAFIINAILVIETKGKSPAEICNELA